jgi:hypothetical protein
MLDAEPLAADGNDLPVSRIGEESSQQMPSNKSRCTGEEGGAARRRVRHGGPHWLTSARNVARMASAYANHETVGFCSVAGPICGRLPPRTKTVVRIVPLECLRREIRGNRPRARRFGCTRRCGEIAV